VNGATGGGRRRRAIVQAKPGIEEAERRNRYAN
jgi:hypothetical protein